MSAAMSGTATPAAPPVSTPAGAPPAAAPPSGEPTHSTGGAAPGTAPASDPPVSAGISLEQEVLAPTLNGERVKVKVGDLLKAWQHQPTPERIEMLGLLDKAVANGDVEAARQLMTKLSPPANPAAATPGQTQPSATGDPRLDQALKEIAELRKTMEQNVTPTVTALREAGTAQLASTIIAATKDKAPLTAKHPQGATMVAKYVRTVAQKNGVDFDSLPAETRQQAISTAIADVENNLGGFFKAFGVDPAAILTPSAANNGRPNITAVDDQHRGVPESGVIPPRWKADPTTGQLVQNTQPTGTLPATPINGAPGGAPGAAPAAGNGRLDSEAMKNLMRSRRGVTV